MHLISSNPNYQPIQFTETELDEKYERIRQKNEHEFREGKSLKALHHESDLEELPTSPDVA